MTRLPSPRPPKVPLWRRGCAFAIDFVGAWLFSSLFAGNWFSWLVGFMLAWLGLRLVAANLNRGQSLGHWALDMVVLEEDSNRIPLAIALAKREAISGLAAFLAMVGFANLDTKNAFYLLLMLPLAVDLGWVWFEPEVQQAFHDRVSKTTIAGTRRGYSLDLKVKKWWRIAQRTWQQRSPERFREGRDGVTQRRRDRGDRF